MSARAENKIKVVIADDHPLFRDGLRQALLAAPEIKLVAEAANGPEAFRAIREHLPDVAVLDIGMPGLNGFGVVQQIREKRLNPGIIFLTMYNQEDMFNQAFNAGSLGYILKDSAVSDIIQAIRSVAAGKHYLSPSISHYLARRISGRTTLHNHVPGLADLTPAEVRVCKLIAEDKTSKEIAELLEISFRTVETHRANICAKLNLHGSHSLLRFAFDHRDLL
jgi:DNA-binding NarL/FixJ family response regulator